MDQFNIYPELQAWRKDKHGLSQIAIVVDVNGKHVAREKICKLLPNEWSKEKQRVKASCPEAAYINSIIENKISDFNLFLLKRRAFSLPITKQVVLKFVGNKSVFDSFYSYAEQLIENKLLTDGKPYSEDTKRRYMDEVKRLRQFQDSIGFQDITPDWLQNYKAWMQNDYRKKDGTGLQRNSIWKALGFVRMVYREAKKAKLFLSDADPFTEFQVGSFVMDTEKIKYLDTQQMDAIERVLNDNEAIDLFTKKIGWRFLAMCVLGLRISDAVLLDEYFFNDAGDLEFKPYKTRRHGNKAVIPITWDRQRRYLTKTLQDKFADRNPKSFRTTFNNHLQIISVAAGIKMHLTSHVGRHSWGSFLVDAGVEDAPAKSMMGVKSSNTLKTYRHLKQEKLKQEAQKLNGLN